MAMFKLSIAVPLPVSPLVPSICLIYHLNFELNISRSSLKVDNIEFINRPI